MKSEPQKFGEKVVRLLSNSNGGTRLQAGSTRGASSTAADTHSGESLTYLGENGENVRSYLLLDFDPLDDAAFPLGDAPLEVTNV